jgi:hypothetical protein
MDAAKETATIKLQSPHAALATARLIVEKKADNEYDLRTELNGRAEFAAVAQLRIDERNQRLRLQMTEIENPFELLAQNMVDGVKRTSKLQLTLDPTGTKLVYAIESTIVMKDDTDGTMESARILLKHPKREAQIDVLHPAEHRYALHIL